MEGESSLQVLAQVSVALAGFTGVVAVLRERGAWTPLDRLRFRVLLGSSVAALLLSLLPFALYSLHLAPGVVWIISSAALTAYLVVAYPLDQRRSRELGVDYSSEWSPWVPRVLGAVVLAVVGMQLLNVSSLGFHREPGPFVAGVVVLVGISAFVFVRLVAVTSRFD